VRSFLLVKPTCYVAWLAIAKTMAQAMHRFVKPLLVIVAIASPYGCAEINPLVAALFQQAHPAVQEPPSMKRPC